MAESSARGSANIPCTILIGSDSTCAQTILRGAPADPTRGRRACRQQTRDHEQQPLDAISITDPMIPLCHRGRDGDATMGRLWREQVAFVWGHTWPSRAEICMTYRGAQYHAKRRDTHALEYKALRWLNDAGILGNLCRNLVS